MTDVFFDAMAVFIYSKPCCAEYPYETKKNRDMMLTIHAVPNR